MQSEISMTENPPYASVCPIEELTPYLGTHLEVVEDVLWLWGISSIWSLVVAGSAINTASAHLLSIQLCL